MRRRRRWLALSGDAAVRLMRTATSWYDAKDISSSTQQAIPNRNGAGTAQRGSTAGSDTNDPVFLPHDGEDYVWFPGSADNLINVTEGLHSTTPAVVDLAARVHIPAGGLPPNALFTGGTSTHKQLRTVAGRLRLTLRDSANNLWVGQADADPTPVDDGVYWLRGSITVATGETRYYWSSDQVATYDQVTTWNLFSTVTGLAAAPGWGMTTSTERIVGAMNSVGQASDPCSIYGVEWKFDGVSELTWLPSSPFTVSRSTTGLKTTVVTRPVTVLDGVDDYIELPASDTPTFTATTGKHTVVIAFRTFDVGTVLNDRIFDAGSSTVNGLALFWQNGNERLNGRIGGSTTNVNLLQSSGDTPAGPISVAAVVVDNGQAALYSNNAGLGAPSSITGVGAITFGAPRVGATRTAGVNLDGEVFSALSFPGEALTEAELDAIAAGLIAGSYQ